MARRARSIRLGLFLGVLSIAPIACAETEAALHDPFGSPVDIDVLADERGGESLSIENLRMQLSSARLDANVSDNALTSALTGANLIDGGALAGASGIATVIQNSGNQVIIQNNTIINLSVQ